MLQFRSIVFDDAIQPIAMGFLVAGMAFSCPKDLNFVAAVPECV